MAMRARLFRVVTFAADPARGNPAFVLTEAEGAGDRALAAACAMLGADIIAVAGAETGGEIPLKFFTAGGAASRRRTRNAGCRACRVAWRL